MPQFVIEREVPGAGVFSPDQLKAISQVSCGVLRQLGPEIQWVQSFVTPDKIYCIYDAPSEELIYRHAALGGFPANRVSRIQSIIDPSNARSSTAA